MRVLKMAAVSLGLMLTSPGLAVAQEAFVAGAITGALTGGLVGDRGSVAKLGAG